MSVALALALTPAATPRALRRPRRRPYLCHLRPLAHLRLPERVLEPALDSARHRHAPRIFRGRRHYRAQARASKVRLCAGITYPPRAPRSNEARRSASRTTLCQTNLYCHPVPECNPAQQSQAPLCSAHRETAEQSQAPLCTARRETAERIQVSPHRRVAEQSQALLCTARRETAERIQVSPHRRIAEQSQASRCSAHRETAERTQVLRAARSAPALRQNKARCVHHRPAPEENAKRSRAPDKSGCARQAKLTRIHPEDILPAGREAIDRLSEGQPFASRRGAHKGRYCRGTDARAIVPPGGAPAAGVVRH